MSKRDNLLLIDDMYKASLKVRVYTEGMSFDEFASDSKTVDAVVRNFEIIGEASNRIDEDFRQKNPEIEWRRIIGLRNRIVHEYFGVDLEIIWAIVTDYIDELISWLETIRDADSDVL